jgi:hypothetical protein
MKLLLLFGLAIALLSLYSCIDDETECIGYISPQVDMEPIEFEVNTSSLWTVPAEIDSLSVENQSNKQLINR